MTVPSYLSTQFNVNIADFKLVPQNRDVSVPSIPFPQGRLRQMERPYISIKLWWPAIQPRQAKQKKSRWPAIQPTFCWKITEVNSIQTHLIWWTTKYIFKFGLFFKVFSVHLRFESGLQTIIVKLVLWKWIHNKKLSLLVSLWGSSKAANTC